MKHNTTLSIRNLLSKSLSTKHKTSLKFPKSNNENDPPLHPNVKQLSPAPSPSKSLSFNKPQIAPSDGYQPEESKSQDPPLKSQNEILESDGHCEVSPVSDPPVKVVVRVRPMNDHERDVNRTVRKVSPDSLSVGDRTFTFDSVFDLNSNQEEIFQSVGVPLVKNALAGYNASILSYGQTGSGKTYTMWGPPSAMVEDPSPRSQQGIAPRLFQKLFTEIQREQDNSDGKQINYQCRCSFLEIYNEQIGDLLDPTQRNLEIKDDPKNGFYVENLTEEYVTGYEDVTQILIKGLSSRKVGATSINSKSSRSHIVFTFILESWCKEASSKFSSSKTSRISLIDLAGADRNKLDEVGRQSVKEGKYVKKSLSQLGYLVNALVQETQPGKPEDAVCRNSCLTHLLQESLGGNAKLTVICNVSPDNKNIGEILSTIRFGQRIRCIRNDPVVNEISEDDVNDLSDQIRQLKEELIRAKCDVSKSVASRNGAHFRGKNVRDSINQLRVSLNRSLILPRIDNDFEEEVNYYDEGDVKELREQLDKLHKSDEEESSRDESCEADLMSEDDMIYPQENELEEICVENPQNELPTAPKSINHAFRSSISISSCHNSTIFQEPTLSESPKIGNIQRKSMAFRSSHLASQNNLSESSKSDVLRQSLKHSEHLRSSLQSSATESLAASLQRGLQIIDNHQQNSLANRASVAFSFEHLMLKPCPEVDKTNASIQRLPEETPSGSISLCASCRQQIDHNSNEVNEEGISQGTRDGAEPIKREELENICKKQAAKIEQLTRLVEQYNHGQESNALCVEALQNAIVPLEEATDKCEIKEVQEVMDHHKGHTYFDLNEKEALLREIESLKSKLQSNTENLRSSLLSRSLQLRKSVDCRPDNAEELEKERERWTEMESEWICLTDDLRVDLESSRQHAQKVEMELRSEKQCTEELDDALNRAVLGHARMVEHYADLQEKYNDLVGRHRAMMEGIAELKRAAAKAGTKGGSRFAKSLAAELSAVRVEREREREFLKKENKSLKIQLRDTAEAVHAAGELLVRLREAEHAASVAEENFSNVQQENEKLKKQIEKVKIKHKMEINTMKQYLAESRLPESALKPLYREDSDVAVHSSTTPDYDDQAWRAEFGAIYQEHY